MIESFFDDVSQVLYVIFVSAAFFICFILPLILTVKNIIHLFSKKTDYEKKRKTTRITIILGMVLSILGIGLISDYQWNEPVVMGEPDSFTSVHEPFSSDYALSLTIFAVGAELSLLILDRKKTLPPLAAVLCISGVYGGIILGMVYITQLSVNMLDVADGIVLYLILYPINFMLCAVRVIGDSVEIYTRHIRELDIPPKNAFESWLRKALEKWYNVALFPIIGLIPFTGAMLCICILTGQGPAGIIKAFTETSDWAYSAMISPPPIEYEGHYLCTVAVNGHESVVKPTRLGIRHGGGESPQTIREHFSNELLTCISADPSASHIIVVNRQLCIANAFEQLIEDRAPRFHRAVRYIYDTYGYPISKHIDTKLRADAVYIIMKPLEWLFLTVLYLFDRDPESRIAVQYTGRHVSEFID